MKRRPTRELLDDDLGTPAEIADSLGDLRWFNRWFGGLSTTRKLFETIAREAGHCRFSVLEVASGDGYLIQTVANALADRGIQLDVTLLDRAASHLPRNGGMPKVTADALSLPFRDGSFDLVVSSLFLHHLPPGQSVQFAREALRVCGTAVLVHDLIRHPLHLALAYAGLPLYRSRITRNDAPASVWQAYTAEEVAGFFRLAGAADVQVQEQYLYRMGLLARKTQ
ncbi:MAG TPA: methyltransferase domain-containing protein [Terriglobales bacterium]|nr:methyltransferase domain-containing protein [Terriglobales bacterium]